MKSPLTLTFGLATLAVATLPLAALADAPFHASNNETGSTYHLVPPGAPDARRLAADPNWEFKGGETGWDLRQHAYDFRDGRAVHADAFDHATPRARIDARDLARRNVELGGA